MNYGFIAICIIMIISLLYDSNHHGETRKINIWGSLVSMAIWMILILWSLHFRI